MLIQLRYACHTDGATKRALNDSNMLVHRPSHGGTLRTSTLGGSTPTTIHLNGSVRPTSGRPQSAKKQRLFVKTNKGTGEKKISVNNRPYSAPKFSPYMEKVAPSSPQRRVKSGHKFKPTFTY